YAGFVFRAVLFRIGGRRLAADRGERVRQPVFVQQLEVGEQVAFGAQGAREVGHLRGRPEGRLVAGAGEGDDEDVLDLAGFRFGCRRRRGFFRFRFGFGFGFRFGRGRFFDWFRFGGGEECFWGRFGGDFRFGRHFRFRFGRGFFDRFRRGRRRFDRHLVGGEAAPDQGRQRRQVLAAGAHPGGDDRRGGDYRGSDEQAEAFAGEAGRGGDRRLQADREPGLHRGTSGEGGGAVPLGGGACCCGGAWGGGV